MLTEAGYSVFYNRYGLFTTGGLLTASKFPITKTAFVPFHNQGNIFSMAITEHVIQKGFHRLAIRSSGKKTFTLINTQLHCPFGAYTSPIPDTTSLHQFRQLTALTPRQRCVLTGDFNFVPSNALYTKLTEHFIDPLAKTEKITITPENSHRKFLPSHKNRVDFTFLSPDIAKGASAKIIFNTSVNMGNGRKHHLSDHFGLRTILRLL